MDFSFFSFLFYRYFPPLFFGALDNGYTCIANVKIQDVFTYSAYITKTKTINNLNITVIAVHINSKYDTTTIISKYLCNGFALVN